MADNSNETSYRHFYLSLNRGVTTIRSGTEVALTRGGETIRLESPDGPVMDLLAMLATGPVAPGTIRDLCKAKPAIDRLAVIVILDKLHKGGWLAYSAWEGRTPLVTAFPMSPASLTDRNIAGGAAYVMSRFCYLRAYRGDLVVTAPVSSFEAVFHSPFMTAVLAHFSAPASVTAVSSCILANAAVHDCALLLLRMGIIEEARSYRVEDDHADGRLDTWEFHDLIYHLRAREGFHDYQTGGTYRFAGRITPLPAVRAIDAAGLVQLPRPANISPEPESHLFNVLDRRRSVREDGWRHVSLPELAEFLYRSARLTGLYETAYGEVATRPYPSGGGLHELEVYVLVASCTGLPPGCYRYEAAAHGLDRIDSDNACVQLLLEDAARSSLRERIPDVLIVIAARFRRLSWKYEGIAYSLMLKHVGCLMQTMYLVATAMKLTPCAIGNGNSRIFAQAIGADPFAEPSVGEFVLSGPARRE